MQEAVPAGCPRAGSSGPQPFSVMLPASDDYLPLLSAGQSVSMRSGCVTLRPGQECGAHSTESYEEMLICLEGAGCLELGAGLSIALAANGVLYVPPHTRHNVRNTGTVRMRYVYVVAPAAETVVAGAPRP